MDFAVTNIAISTSFETATAPHESTPGTTELPCLIVSVAAQTDGEDGFTDTTFKVQIKQAGFMALSLSEITQIAIARTNNAIRLAAQAPARS